MIAAQAERVSMPLAPQNVTQGATATANIDTRGAKYASISVQLGSNTNAATSVNNVTLALSQSDTTNATTFATVVSNVTVSGTATALYEYKVDLRGKSRYLRLAVTPGTTTNDARIICANARLSRLDENPGTVASTTNGFAPAGQVIA
ncbi:hypothetical protein EBZ39_03655 [bacterium]|nr:hypothetical protein [bacterium]